MAKSQARRAPRARDVVPNDLEDEEALHEGEDEAGISQKGLDRLMRALGPDSLGEMDMALLEQLRNDEDEEQGEDEDENDDEEEDGEEEEEDVEDLIDDEAEEDDVDEEGEEDDDNDDEDVEDLIDDEAEEEDADDDEEDDDDDDDDDDEEDIEDLIDDEAEEDDVDEEEEEDSEGHIGDESKEAGDEDDAETDNTDGKKASSSAPKDSLAASILRSGLVPDEEDDDDEEEEEEAEHDDDEEEIPLDSLPSSASLSEQALASRHNRIRINNTEAMQRVYEDMRLDGPSTSGKMPWIETMSLVYEHATADEVPDAQNDLDRELSFYRQSLAAAIRGRELVLAANVSFSRPNDYFAEMVKTDEHMERVRQRLLDESASIKASEDAKRQRELKKYGKKIQTEKLFERQRSKRDMQEKVNALKRKRQTGLDMDDDEFDVQLEEALGERKAAQRTQRGPNKKRQYRDEKYGFGGKKRHNKSNTAESTDQVGPSRRKPGSRPKGGKAKRPGKARRAARR